MSVSFLWKPCKKYTGLMTRAGSQKKEHPRESGGGFSK